MIRGAAVLLLVAIAAAAPDDDLGRAAAARVVLDEGLDAFSGLASESDARAVFSLGSCVDRGPIVEELLAAACGRGAHPSWQVRPTFGLELGNGAGDNLSGDDAAGWFGPRVGARAALYSGPMVLRASPRIGLDTIPGVAPTLSMSEVWIGYDRGKGWIGVGTQDRWMGVGHHGTPLL